MRVHELSKELGVTNKHLIDIAKSIGVSLKSHASSLGDKQASQIKNIIAKPNDSTSDAADLDNSVIEPKEKVRVFKSDSGQEVVERRTAGKVILRRKKKIEVAPEIQEDTEIDEAIETKEGIDENEITVQVSPEVSISEEAQVELIEEISKQDEELSPITDEDLKASQPAETEEHEELKAEADMETASQLEEIPEHDKDETEGTAKPEKRTKKKGKAVKPQREEIIDEDTLEELRKAFRTKLPVRKREYLVDNRRLKARAYRDKIRHNRSSERSDQQSQIDLKYDEQPEGNGQVIPFSPRSYNKLIKMPESINVGELAKRMGIKAVDILKKLFSIGITSSLNKSIDHETATILAAEFGYEVETDIYEEDEHLIEKGIDTDSNTVERYPVVTVMGHVDHGKTTLLDIIRKTNVAEGEAGGITQHIGAYSVSVKDKKVTFIDTPGHEAFTSMRARGAQLTDVVILVVAADDGAMPQTIEAIDHAKAAGAPIIVAINKIDKVEADPDKVKRELSEIGLVPEDWGGDTLFAQVSAKSGKGIEELLELILLQADVLELKINPNKRANGIVVESKLDKGRGPVASVIVKEGTLNIGDFVISGVDQGRVRALINDQGENIKSVGPSIPAEIMGFATVPSAGVPFYVVKDEKTLKDLISHRESKARDKLAATVRKVSLENLFENIEKGDKKELPLILKADTQGSIEALKDSIDKLSSDKCTVKIVHYAVGAINESDVILASASNAIIFGFGIRPDPKAIALAERESVVIESHSIIYDALDRIKNAMEGLLDPIKKENVLGHAEVRATFHVSKIGTIAGCYMMDGKAIRNSNVRVVRDGRTIYDGIINSLKRFKDDVKDVQSGYECGIGVQNFNDIKVSDILEVYKIEEERQKL